MLLARCSLSLSAGPKHHRRHTRPRCGPIPPQHPGGGRGGSRTARHAPRVACPTCARRTPFFRKRQLSRASRDGCRGERQTCALLERVTAICTFSALLPFRRRDLSRAYACRKECATDWRNSSKCHRRIFLPTVPPVSSFLSQETTSRTWYNVRQTLVNLERVVDGRLLRQKEYSAISLDSQREDHQGSSHKSPLCHLQRES